MQGARQTVRRQQYSSEVTSPGEALGQSEPFLQFQEQLSKVAAVDRPVLLIGERGTGKELAARRLHYLSQRWSGPCVTLNCAALSPTLIESELFGYEKGAFTGAENRRTGRFEAADGGTLFLDEIGNIPMEAQGKILRVVEYAAFERVGSSAQVEVDVRIVGATNADLPAMAERGEFKRDLLDRLSFEVLFLPPLRAREEDIMLLARHFAGRMAYELGRDQVPDFSPGATDALERYEWPGNIRELKNVVERAVYSAERDTVTNIVFNPFLPAYPLPDAQGKPVESVVKLPQQFETDASGPPSTLREALKNLEISMLRKALEQSRFNRKKAAKELGLTYDQLRGLMRKYGDDVLGRSK
jgi:psp operon transcriptional activator